MKPNRMEFEADLDELLRLARKHRAAEIDAGACGTETDFHNEHTARDKYEESKEKFLDKYAGPDTFREQATVRSSRSS